MSSELRYDGKVVVVTGAGNGLGRSHALLFASRGAKVVVNDLGGSFHGEGKGTGAADKVVAEIKAAGGRRSPTTTRSRTATRSSRPRSTPSARVDIVVNNAGILRDVSFQKMTDQDWDLIYKVHVLGAYRVTHAAWPHMREQGYGRIIFTASAAGHLRQLRPGELLDGEARPASASPRRSRSRARKKNMHVNTIAPIAGSRMTETVLPKELLDALKPEYVSPLVAWLAHESCEENGGMFEVGGGFFAKLRWERTEGKMFKLGR